MSSPNEHPRIPTPAHVKHCADENRAHEYRQLVSYVCSLLMSSSTGIVTHTIPRELEVFNEGLVQEFIDAGYEARVLSEYCPNRSKRSELHVSLPGLKYFDAPGEVDTPSPRLREDASNLPAMVAALCGTVAVIGAFVAWVLL